MTYEAAAFEDESCLRLRGYLPLLDGSSSQATWAAAQLWHGFASRTLQRTRRALQFLHACLARVDRLGGPLLSSGEGMLPRKAYLLVMPSDRKSVV